MNTTVVLKAFAWAGVFFSILSGGSAYAGIIYCANPNSVYITANQTLESTYLTMGTAPCIILQNGANLNMDGNEIQCNNEGGCGIAILVEDAGSDVHDGKILVGYLNELPTGEFFSIGLQGAEKIRRMDIHGAATAIISKRAVNAGDPDTPAKKVEKNVLTGCTDCIGVDMDVSTGAVLNNYVVVSGGGVGIEVSGTASGNGPRIERNYIRNYGTGIKADDGTKVRIKKNIVADPASTQSLQMDISSSVSPGGNLNLCADLSVCDTPEAPFTLP